MIYSIFFFLMFSPLVSAVEPILPQMVTIPAGKFIYGVSEEYEKSKNWIPQRWDQPECIKECAAFSIAVYETSTAEVYRFIQDGGYQNPQFWSEAGNCFRPKYSQFIPKLYPENDSPCVGISYYEAEAYCRWLALKTGQPYRLPTEIEWEKAARGTDGRIYPWGNEWNPHACNWGDIGGEYYEPNGGFDGGKYAVARGKYPQGISPYGCFDMAGNAWEWCDSIMVDRLGRKRYVLRGGCFWMANPRFFTTTNRKGSLPEFGLVVEGVTGFRIAKSE